MCLKCVIILQAIKCQFFGVGSCSECHNKVERDNTVNGFYHGVKHSLTIYRQLPCFYITCHRVVV